MKRGFGIKLVLVAAAVISILWLAGSENVSRLSLFTRGSPTVSPQNTPAAAGESASLSAKPNLTNKVAEQVTDELLSKNKEGPQGTGNDLNITLNPAETLQKLIQATVSTSSITINDSELTIIYADNADVRQEYFAGFQKITADTIGAQGLPTILDAYETLVMNQNPEPLARLTNAHLSAIDAFKKLPVPAALLSLHKEEIGLLMKTEVMLEGLASFLQDPMRSYIAFQMYPELVDSANDLQNNFRTEVQK